LKDGLAIGLTNEMHEPVFPNGTAVCEVEIDPDTGWIDLKRYATVDDVGRCINPLIVHGQTHGGIAQGVGQAMFELFELNEDGQPVAASFMDYGMPRAEHLSMIDALFNEVPCKTNDLGVKGAGEAGACGAPGAFVSAVCDALKDFGIRHIDMPMTPDRVWATIQKAKAGKAA
jgi:carbon-monoxide dehydrogenase large subunit